MFVNDVNDFVQPVNDFNIDGYFTFVSLFRKLSNIKLGGGKIISNNYPKTCKTVLTIDKNDDYLNLPFRIPLSSFKIGPPIVSYGIILRHKSEYLVVHRKESIEYIDFVRGNYRISHLYLLLQGISDCERDKIINNDFEILWTDHCGKPPSGDPFIHALKMFNQIKHFLPELFDHIKSINPDGKNQYIFPKGRLEYQYSSDITNENLDESPVDCALREFIEETDGLVADSSWCIFPNPIGETYIGSNSKNYTTRYFIFETPTKLISENPDISWVHFDEMKDKVIPRKYDIVSFIESSISSEEDSIYCDINEIWLKKITLS